jgi:predicted MarR family transcription regulator
VLAAARLAWDETLLAFHQDQDYLATASYRDVRRPLYRSSVGRARAYARHLEPFSRLLAALGPLPA